MALTTARPSSVACCRAAVGRLQAVSRRLCLELEEEQELQLKIKAVLTKNE